MCISHVFNIRVEKCTTILDAGICKACAAINSIHILVVRRDLLKEIWRALKIQSKFPHIHSQKRRSSTFKMLRSAYNCRRVLNAAMKRTGDLSELLVSEHMGKSKTSLWRNWTSCCYNRTTIRFFLRYIQYKYKAVQKFDVKVSKLCSR